MGHVFPWRRRLAHVPALRKNTVLARTALAAAGLAVASPALAQVTWDGSCATDNWHTCCAIEQLFDNNWETDPAPRCPPFPGPNDEVDLNGARVRLDREPADVRNLFNGDLILAHSLGVTQAVNLGALTMISHDITAGGDIIIAGPLTWRAGTLAGPPGSRVGANGPISINDLGNAVLDGRTLVANAAVSWTGTSDIALNNGAAFDNRVSLSLNNNEFIGGDGGTFLNNAPFGKSDSVGETTVLGNVFFDNTDLGAIDVATGTLKFEGGGQNRGTISVNEGATIRFATFGNHTFTIQTNTIVAGSGLIWVSGSGPGLTAAANVRFGAQNLLLTGAMSGPGRYDVGDMTWTSGTIDGGGVTEITGTLTLAGALNRTLGNHQLDLRGNGTWEGAAQLSIGNGFLNNFGGFTIRNEPKTAVLGTSALWTNAPGSTLDIQTDVSFIGPGGAATLRNVSSSMNVGPGVTLCDFNGVSLEHLGQADIRSGTLRVRGGRSSGASFNLDPGTLELVSRPFGVGADTRFNGMGIVRIGAGGTLDFQAMTTEIANLELTGFGGTITGPGQATITNRLQWTDGQMTGGGETRTTSNLDMDGAAAKVLSQRTLGHEGGGGMWTAGNFVLNNGARFVNAANAVFDIQTLGNFAHNVGEDGLVDNHGNIRKVSGNALLTFPAGVQLINRNMLEVQAGDVVLRGGGTSSGTIAVAQGSNVRFSSGEYTLDGGRIQGAGFAKVDGDILTIQGMPQVQNIELVSQRIQGPGTLTVTQLLKWTDGIIGRGGNGTVTIAPDARVEMTTENETVLLEDYILNNQGAGLLSGNNAVLQLRRAIWNNLGSLELRGNPLIASLDDQGEMIVNTGTIEKTGAADTSVPVSVALTNAGSVRVRSGDLILRGGGSSTGTFDVAGQNLLRFESDPFVFNAGTRIMGEGNAIVDFFGTVTVNADAEATNFIVRDGTLNGPGVLNVTTGFRWSAGTLSGTGATAIRGFGITSAVEEKTLDQRRVLNFGVLDWDGLLNAINGGKIVNAGTFRMGLLFDADSVFTGADAGIFENERAGIIEKHGQSSAVLDVVVNNAGRIVVRSGTLRFGHTFTQTAGSVVVLGGQAEFDNPVRLQGGTIGGNGRVLIQRLTNASGIVKPGESPGQFTLEGDYMQEPNGALEIELGGLAPGDQHDVFVVTGDATLGGTLDIRLIDGFEPQVGDTFTVMTYGSAAGEFARVVPPCGYAFDIQYNANDVTLEVTGVAVPTPGDLDGDCDVDLDDYRRLAPCIGGPGVEMPPQGCDADDFLAADLDTDRDVDIKDVREHFNAFDPS